MLIIDSAIGEPLLTPIPPQLLAEEYQLEPPGY